MQSTATHSQTNAPLKDIKVLELGSMLAGPFVGTMLADFGATVIKLEKPGKPDALREWPPHKGEVPLWWKSMARNKHLITLDISRAEGRDIALELLASTDIVIENFKPGTLERWGLGPDELAERFPHIVWVRVSGYGQTGPLSARGGYATIAEGFSGLASFSGFPQTGPAVSSFPMGDYLAGIFGAFGALAAHHHREKTGQGQVVDVSLFEPLFRIVESVVLRYDQTQMKKPLLGNQMEEDVPRNVYVTADKGYVAVSCGSQRIFENLLAAMDRKDLLGDARFETMARRVENRNVIDQIVADWVAQRQLDDVMAAFDTHGVVAGPIMDIQAIFDNAHYAARQAISTVDDPDLGMLRMPAPVPKLSVTPAEIRWAGKKTGADNEAVFAQINLSPERLAHLKETGVI
ncbi:CaiB/BaiF CoA transferase family protein [Allopusillimonas ginsengisoli]|uniref:CaiB/BaiF CoA transferase family protein n=1 Tax=Allopusillimonas ginsengisoli TaxID=453575 RepID=UPI00142FF3FB|nr:CoA transferase [Allopusillimonas ginsengisoli]